ncbi:uncharacterized protein LOC122393851 isoform X1 [Amphibalanus amphitrite]|uniref:uncharacterized protein LOC122393851 isoform X1 n=1 Tax=Amphibalanus amphitrite TaxID=1232801 RepID=UPI001C90ABD6|nr:uncharacterized protein LOC122393851 isoform X1 [Amphibalanus amphitrite]
MTNFVIRRSGVSFPKNILIQDGACNKPLDANKALLKALGATGAGAVIVGAVTGEVNTTWGRAKSQNIIQDQSQTSFIKQQQTNQLTVHEKVTSLTTEKQREPDQISFEENGAGPVPIQDGKYQARSQKSMSPRSAQQRSDLPKPSPVSGAATSDPNQQLTGGGAPTAAAVAIGTGSTTETALTAVTLHPDNEAATTICVDEQQQKSAPCIDGDQCHEENSKDWFFSKAEEPSHAMHGSLPEGLTTAVGPVPNKGTDGVMTDNAHSAQPEKNDTLDREFIQSTEGIDDFNQSETGLASPSLSVSSIIVCTKKPKVDAVQAFTSNTEDVQHVPGRLSNASASVSTAELRPVNKNEAREEADTLHIVSTKKRTLQITPGYDKFPKIVATTEVGRQISLDRTKVGKPTAHEDDNGTHYALFDAGQKFQVREPGDPMEKCEDNLLGTHEFATEAACGSSTDVQEKIDSCQSSIASVNEELVLDVDRISIGSHVCHAITTSGLDRGINDTNGNTMLCSSDVRGEKTSGDTPPDVAVTSNLHAESTSDCSHTEQEAVPILGTYFFRTSSSGQRLPENFPEPDRSISEGQGWEVQCERKCNAAVFCDNSNGAKPIENEDIAQNVSERTEDFDFDPLTSRSLIFPEELEERSSQLSEKPSSPFPDFDESDGTTTTAPSFNEMEHTLSETDRVITQEVHVTTSHDIKSPSNESYSAAEGDEIVFQTHSMANDVNTLITTAKEDEKGNKEPSYWLGSSRMTPAVQARMHEEMKSGYDAQIVTQDEFFQDDSEKFSPETSTLETIGFQPKLKNIEKACDVGGEGKKFEQPPCNAEEHAATKIQAGIRGWQTRRKIHRQQAAATKIQAGFRGWRKRRTHRMRHISLLPNVSSDGSPASGRPFMDVNTLRERAAAKIQAGYRDWRTRQCVKSLMAANCPLGASGVSPAISITESGDEEQAASHIQAGYRGWRARRTLKHSLSDPNSEALALAKNLQPNSVSKVGASSDWAAIHNSLTLPTEVVTPGIEDETPYSAQTICSEVVTGGGTSRLEHGDMTSHVVQGLCDNMFTSSITEPFSATKTAGDTPQTNMKRTENLVSGQLAATTSCNDSLQVRPTVSAKSVMDSGALPIDFAIVHRPEDDWLTQDLIKIEAEKSVTSRRDCFSRETDEKVDASTGEELDTKNANDTLPGSASTTGSSSSWLAHAQTEIQASFQGLRDNVNDALRTVEDTARLVQENDVTLENVATTDRDCKCRSVRI